MKKKGFTLIELMIAIAIFTIFSMYLYQVFFSQIRQSFNFNNNIDIQRNANKALNMLTDEIRDYSFSDIKPGTQVLSNDKVIIDLSGNTTSNADIYYNSANKVLSDNNGNQCSNIDSVKISQGASSDNEGDLILITVSASEGTTQIKSFTAVNIKK